MLIALIISLLFNVVLIVLSINLVDDMPSKSNHRRGYISTTAEPKSFGTTYRIRALIEEIENLGTKSRVKYLEVTGIDKCFHEQAKDVMGTIIDHNKIEWINPPEEKQ